MKQLSDIHQAFQVALRLHRAGQISKAQSIYNDILQRDPKHFDALHLLGSSLIQQGHIHEGIRYISAAVTIKPSSSNGFFNLGLGQYAGGDIESAVSSFDRAIALRPDEAEYHAARAKALEAKGQFTAALASYEKAMSLSSGLAQALVGKISILLKLNRIEEANLCCGKAVKLETMDYDSLTDLGNCLRKLKRFDEAVTACDRAIAMRPDRSEAYFACGRIFHERKEYKASIISYDKAIDISPNEFKFHLYKAQALKELVLIDQSLASYARAIALKSDDYRAYFNRGNLLKESKRFDEALNDYDKVIELRPSFAEAYCNRGNVLLELKLPNEALESHEKAISLQPDYAEAYCNRGNALYELSRPDEALESHDRAIALKPEYAEAYSNRGAVLKDLKRPDEARASYDAAIALKPDFAEFRHNKSHLLLSLGEYAEGFDLYRSRFDTKEFAGRSLCGDIPRWDGSSSSGRLLLWAEQGIGDEIFYASMLSLIPHDGMAITVSADKRLHPIYERSFPHVRLMDRKSHGSLVEEDFTAQAPIGDLGAILNVNAAKIQQRRYPFLSVNQERKREIMEGGGFPKSRPVCGVSWKSSNKKSGGERSARLLDLSPCLNTMNFAFVNLQYGDVSQEIEDTRSKLGLGVHEVEGLDVFNDIDGLLSLIDACDVVLTTDNTTAHLAGSIGKHGIVMIPSGKGRIWYWRGDSTSTWYPSLRLVVHENGSSWQSTIKKAMELIEKLFGRMDVPCGQVLPAVTCH